MVFDWDEQEVLADAVLAGARAGGVSAEANVASGVTAPVVSRETLTPRDAQQERASGGSRTAARVRTGGGTASWTGAKGAKKKRLFHGRVTKGKVLAERDADGRKVMRYVCVCGFCSCCLHGAQRLQSHRQHHGACQQCVGKPFPEEEVFAACEGFYGPGGGPGGHCRRLWPTNGNR